MTDLDFRTVHVCTDAGVWHVATQNMDSGTILSPEGCNLDDAERLEMYPDLPEWVRGIELCKRCHPTTTDR